jgi:hypothetical protein
MKEMVRLTTAAEKLRFIEELDKIGKEPTASCKIIRKIEDFTFTVPNQTLDDWLKEVRKEDPYPQQGVHWKIDHWVTFKNANQKIAGSSPARIAI